MMRQAPELPTQLLIPDVAATRLWLTLAILFLFGASLPGPVRASRAVLERASAAGASLTVGAAQQLSPVVTVSAASFETTAVTPDSIVAAFGVRLATQTAVAAAIPLPTELSGTTVEVNGQRAGLFFVSPEQVNFLIPAQTQVGPATVVVRAGDGTVSQGMVQLSAVAPAIFTANSAGQGRPAALLYLVRANGQLVIEPLSDRPISFSPGERAVLALFLSGLRRAPDPDGDGNLRETVRVVIGGVEVTPDYAGRQPDFVGLDQINVSLPHSLSGRGQVNLTIAGRGFAASNLAELEFGSGAGSAPPSVSSFAPAPLLAGQMLQINGSGFAASPAETIVRLGGIEARLVSASVSQLAVQAPFGARSGSVSVRTPQGEGVSREVLRMRTSLSGFIENTSRQPLSGVKVRVAGTSITAQTGAEGSFILPDVSPGPAVVEVDSSAIPVTPPFPQVVLKTLVGAEQDNPFPRPISLQQATGSGISVGSPISGFGAVLSVMVPTSAPEITETTQTGNVTFEVPGNAAVRFPDGAMSGILTLTLVENSRTPVNLPLGLFSSVIVQISPFGATINPGGKLTFPNPDGFPAGAQVRLFRLDQAANSPTLGNFIEAGTATVSADGQRIETAANAVTETSYYFVSNPQLTTTVTGRVVDGDGRTPVRLALVRARGQETFTDGNGSFVLRQIALKSEADPLTVEASYVRPSGRVDRVQRDNVAAVVSGITTVTPDLVLPPETSNRPPVIICPPNLALNIRDTSNITCAVYDPDPGQTVEVTIAGVSFATLSKGNNDSYTLRLTPGPNDLGDHALTMTATDSQGTVTTHTLSLKVAPTTISCGQTRTASLGSVAQRDTYTFIGKANDVVIITAKGTSGAVCAVAEVYKPDNMLLIRPPCNTSNRITLPSDGTYTILVYDSGLNNTGGYNLNLQFADGRCGTPLSCGQTQKASFTSITQHQVYTFRGEPNEVVHITAKGTSGAVCAVTEVYGPTGTLVKAIPCNTSSGRLTLPSSGVYTILVYESGLDNTGGYDLNLQFADGRCANASLECGQTTSTSLTSITQHHIYTFSGKADDVVYVTAKGTSGAVCTVAEIFSPAGTLVKATSCNTSSGRLTLPADGTYTILVHDSGLNNTGGYNLNLQFADGRCGTPIRYGQTLNASLTSITQHHVYTFTGNANQLLDVVARGTSGAVCAVAEVYRPDGVLLIAASCNQSTGNFTLPQDGKYTIVIYDFGLNNTGGYSINLICIGANCGSALNSGRHNQQAMKLFPR